MLIRILNMLRSRIWDMVLFLFSDYLLFGFRRKLVFRFEEEWGDCLEVYGFHPNRSSRRGIFSYGKIVLWLKIIIFWRIPFSFQQKSLICYLFSKPDSRWDKTLCAIVRKTMVKKKRIVISLILFRCAKRFILPQKTKTSEKRVRSFQSQNSTAQSHKMQYL